LKTAFNLALSFAFNFNLRRYSKAALEELTQYILEHYRSIR
jgi:hypothetical protein